MVEFSNITSLVMQWIINPLIWLVLLLFFSIGIYIILIVRKKRRMNYPAIEIVDLGDGKTNFNNLKCGWIGEKIYLNGLWWSGREVMRTNSMEIINQFSEQDFQEIDGKRGIIFYRNPLQKTLLPINRLKIQNKELVATIPPAEFVNASVDIIKSASKEMTDKTEKIIQFVSWALVVIFSLVAIIVIIQMVKNGQKEANDLILEAGKTCLENAKEVCSAVINARSDAP